MTIKPIHIWQADEFVEKHHRHCKKAGNGKFAIACYEGEELIGVGIAGRPRCIHDDDRKTLEIYRVCTLGHHNASSFITARLRRIGQLMGYEKFQTHTLQSESGASLRAIGAVIVKEVKHKKKKWNDSKGIKRNITQVSPQLKFKWTL